MIEVRIFGLFRARTEKRELELEPVATLRELLPIVAGQTGIPVEEWRQASIFVNGEPMHRLRMLSTRLKDGDKIALLSPASGG